MVTSQGRQNANNQYKQPWTISIQHQWTSFFHFHGFQTKIAARTHHSPLSIHESRGLVYLVFVLKKDVEISSAFIAVLDNFVLLY